MFLHFYHARIVSKAIRRQLFTKQTPMLQRFRVIFSFTANAELNQDEIQPLLQNIVETAIAKDQDGHEGQLFSFERNGKEWAACVDVQQAWSKS